MLPLPSPSLARPRSRLPGGGYRLLLLLIFYSSKWAWTELGDPLHKAVHHLSEFLTFGGGDPLQMKTILVQAELQKHHLEQGHSPAGPVVASDVVAVAGMAAEHHNPVRALLKGVKNKLGIDSGGTERADDPEVRCYLQPADTGQVRPGVGAPVAAEYQYFRLKTLAHFLPLPLE